MRTSVHTGVPATTPMLTSPLAVLAVTRPAAASTTTRSPEPVVKTTSPVTAPTWASPEPVLMATSPLAVSTRTSPLPLVTTRPESARRDADVAGAGLHPGVAVEVLGDQVARTGLHDGVAVDDVEGDVTRTGVDRGVGEAAVGCDVAAADLGGAVRWRSVPRRRSRRAGPCRRTRRSPCGAMIAIRSPRSRTSNSSARSPVMRTVVSVVSVAVTSTVPRPFST